MSSSEQGECEIVLATLNAKYAHASLALRYLYANLGELQNRACIQEYIWNERSVDLAEKILALKPRLLGLGVYIWNAKETLALIRILKAVQPDLVIVLGGPEVSHETHEQELSRVADYVITGEGEDAFRNLASSLLVEGKKPLVRTIAGGLPNLPSLVSPYSYYSDEDLAKRTLYVEASRGCPFRCEFCLSSLDQKVRQFPLDEFLCEMKTLLDRGARQFKFIDRTFNLRPKVSQSILEFFLDHMELGLFLHFEMVPDRLPASLREMVARFPPGSIQFEIGIQTFDEDTSVRISRKQDLVALEDNLRFLVQETEVHIHADLIMGLPGESEESFARGFDRLVGLAPHEVQVGVLKRLRGTPIIRHDEEYEMRYSSSPPYEILQTSVLPFAKLAEMKRFARSWDLVANRGNFPLSLPQLWANTTPYAGFSAFSQWLFSEVGHFSGIALDRLFRLLLVYLSEVRSEPLSLKEAAQLLCKDYGRSRPRLPAFLAEPACLSTEYRKRKSSSPSATPKRQGKHLLPLE